MSLITYREQFFFRDIGCTSLSMGLQYDIKAIIISLIHITLIFLPEISHQ